MKEQLNQKIKEMAGRCSELEEVESKLKLASQELECTSASLKAVTEAKCTLQEEFTRTVSRLNEDFQMQKVNLTEEYEKKVCSC